MKRPQRQSDGYYHVGGKLFKELVGSREKVWNKTAYKTPGGLVRSGLTMNKHHRIVSLKKYKTAKKEKRLEKHGFFAQKGKFGYVKKASKTMKVRGGKADEVPAPAPTPAVVPADTTSTATTAAPSM